MKLKEIIIYTLILTYIYNTTHGNSCSIHSIPGFSTYELATEAGTKWKQGNIYRSFLVVQLFKGDYVG